MSSKLTVHPTKLTPTVKNRFVTLAKKGHHIKTICQAVGIHRDTYYDWLNRADAGEEPFTSWATAVHQARADYLIKLYEKHERMAGKAKNLTALQWIMERGWPALFGNRLRVDSDTLDDLIHAELARRRAERLGESTGGSEARALQPPPENASQKNKSRSHSG